MVYSTNLSDTTRQYYLEKFREELSADLALSLLFSLLRLPHLSIHFRRSMDETEFKRLLNLFPVVRSRSYCQAEAASSSGAASSGGTASFGGAASFRGTTSSIPEEKTKDVQTVGKIDAEDPFWQKLKTAAETKVGSNKAEQFVQAFRDAHEKLVYKKLSMDVARSFIDTARK